MNDVELWLPTVATRNDVQYAILTILLVSGTFFPKNTMYRVNASVEMYQISKECISANFKNKYMEESASKSCCECLIFNKI